MTQEVILYAGHKGGSSTAHQPVETPNNLISKSFAKVLIAVAEGQLAETPTAKDIYLGGTPLQNASGQNNFEGVTWEWRSGTVDQTYIQGMPEVSTEFTVGTELTDTTPWTQSFTSPSLDAIRITIQWPAIMEQKSNGDIVGYNIQYAIDISTNGAAFQQYGIWDTNNGKNNGTYERTHRVDLPRNGTSWTVRVRRITPNQHNALIQDTMYIKTYAEVLDAKFRYPNTALLYIEFDAELFGGTSIPTISVKTKGKIIRVPSNYDPETRVYSGVWNGTFKWAYSNNPAWIFYDLVTNDRFGLGARIKPEMVDKWTLYQVSQYCDVLVPNGLGGQEPRHTCNIYIQSREDAWKVLRDIIGIFNGMLHWDGTQLVASADMPVDISSVRTYNRSDVVDGKFEYASTSANTVYTSAVISYDNPSNHYETATEAINDLSLIQRFKMWSQAEISAIGCTSRGEAQRKGKYTLLTNSLNRIVTFKLGLSGYLPKPSEVIGVADQLLAGQSLAGRISSATASVVTLDRVSNAATGDLLYINMPDGTAQRRTITNVNGKVITVGTAFSQVPQAELGWYVEKTGLKSQLFRVAKIAYDDENAQFTITATQYEDSKYAAIDNGARLEQRPITSIPAGVQVAPASVTVTSFTYLEQTMAVTTMTATWPAAEGAINYEAQWRKDGGDWHSVGVTYSTTFDVKGIYKGAYQVRVRAISAQSIRSAWTLSEITVLNGKEGNPPGLASFTTASEVWGIRLNWTFSPGSDDGAYVQLQQADTIDGQNLLELGLQAYPTVTYLKSDMLGGVVKFFRGRLIDRSGLEGPWTAWTYGISEYGTDKILEELTGQITETQLGSDLVTEIDKISGNGPGSVNERINEAVDELQDQIDNITDALLYDPTKTYVTGDIVRVGQKLYQALQNVPTNTSPPNATYWEDIGQIIEDVNGLAAQVEQNTVNISIIDGKVTYQAQSISSLEARWREDDGTGDLAGTLNQWNNKAAIQQEQSARADADTAMAQSLTVYKAQVDDNLAQVTQQIKVVSTKADENTGAITSLAETVTTLDAKVDDNYASLDQQLTTVATESSANSAAITTLNSKVDDNYSTLDQRITTQASDIEANATAITQLESSVDDNLAVINTTLSTHADEISANATSITTLQTSVGDNTAAIETTQEVVADLNGDLSAMYSIKLGVNSGGKYYAAGMGIGIENTPLGMQSQVLFVADRFAILNTINGVTSSPFIVQGGQTIINNALIGNATIGFAKIADDMQSTNYVAATTGWKLGKGGSLEFNGNVAGGGRLTISNQVLQVFDSNGVLRVRLGIW